MVWHASRLGGAGADLGNAAGKAIAEELDDWCGTKPPRPPFPHRALELATYLAAFVASSTNEHLRTEIGAVVEQLGARAGH